MRILNLGCGGVRPQEPEWTNLDDLHSQLPVGEGARNDLDKETNYINFQLLSGPLPFEDETFDSLLASHLFEHFDAQDGVKLMIECRRILKPGGVLLVSVPDASYFRKVYPEDKKHNWPRLFEVSDPGNPIPTFLRAALFFVEHKMVFTEDALWCMLTESGFFVNNSAWGADVTSKMVDKLNRRKFSLEMVGVK